MLHAASHNFTTITRSDIEAKLKVYAQNPSFAEGRRTLESERILIVSGPPGVGKTTCSIPDDRIDPRRSALFMARSVLRDVRDGVGAC